jgi:hypothetical protein
MLKGVVRALLICSDDDCTAVYEGYGRLEDVERLACDCGCGLAVIGWPEPAEGEPDAGPDLFLVAA